LVIFKRDRKNNQKSGPDRSSSFFKKNFVEEEGPQNSRFNLSAFLLERFNNVPKTRRFIRDTQWHYLFTTQGPPETFLFEFFLEKLVQTSLRESTLVATSAVKFVSRIPTLEGRVITTVFASATRQQGLDSFVSSQTKSTLPRQPPEIWGTQGCQQVVLGSTFFCRSQGLYKVLELRSGAGSVTMDDEALQKQSDPISLADVVWKLREAVESIEANSCCACRSEKENRNVL
jgi:hypothetical protein